MKVMSLKARRHGMTRIKSELAYITRWNFCGDILRSQIFLVLLFAICISEVCFPHTNMRSTRNFLTCKMFIPLWNFNDCCSVDHIQLKLASNHFSHTQKFKTFPVEHAAKPPKGRIWAHPALEPPVLLTPTLLFITHSDWHHWRMMDSFGAAEEVLHVSFPGYQFFL